MSIFFSVNIYFIEVFIITFFIVMNYENVKSLNIHVDFLDIFLK